jgi:opacity protein-like surface antigen
MKQAVLLLPLVSLLAVTTPALAQFGKVQAPPKTTMSVWLGGYLQPGRVKDPASGTWDFGSTLAGGIGVHRRFGVLSVGVDASLAPSASFERFDSTGVARGDARMATALLSARLRTGGGGPIGMYLTGGVGTFIYGMPDLDRSWDPDFALHTGAGLEYQVSNSRSVFLEWGRFWTFHQGEGVRSERVNHSQIRAGLRFGL